MSPARAWGCLVAAGLFEVAWTFFLKRSEGLSRPAPALLFLLTLGLSMGLLGAALRAVPVGVAYPVWTGIGAVGAVLIGTLAFGEPLSPPKALCAACIVAGIVGLRAFG